MNNSPEIEKFAEDFKASLQDLVQRIAKGVDNLVASYALGLAKLEELNGEIVEKTLACSQLSEENKRLTDDSHKVISELDARTRDMEVQENLFKRDIVALEIKKNSIDGEIDSLGKSKETLERALGGMEPLRLSRDTLIGEIANLSKNFNKAKEEYEALEKTNNEAKTVFNKTKDNHQAELFSLQSAREKFEKDNKERIESIASRETSIIEREKALAIYAQRIKNYYAEVGKEISL